MEGADENAEQGVFKVQHLFSNVPLRGRHSFRNPRSAIRIFLHRTKRFEKRNFNR
jgi:hypothetical protein